MANQEPPAASADAAKPDSVVPSQNKALGQSRPEEARADREVGRSVLPALDEYVETQEAWDAVDDVFWLDDRVEDAPSVFDDVMARWDVPTTSAAERSARVSRRLNDASTLLPRPMADVVGYRSGERRLSGLRATHDPVFAETVPSPSVEDWGEAPSVIGESRPLGVESLGSATSARGASAAPTASPRRGRAATAVEAKDPRRSDFRQPASVRAAARWQQRSERHVDQRHDASMPRLQAGSRSASRRSASVSRRILPSVFPAYLDVPEGPPSADVQARMERLAAVASTSDVPVSDRHRRASAGLHSPPGRARSSIPAPIPRPASQAARGRATAEAHLATPGQTRRQGTSTSTGRSLGEGRDVSERVGTRAISRAMARASVLTEREVSTEVGGQRGRVDATRRAEAVPQSREIRSRRLPTADGVMVTPSVGGTGLPEPDVAVSAGAATGRDSESVLERTKRATADRAAMLEPTSTAPRSSVADRGASRLERIVRRMERMGVAIPRPVRAALAASSDARPTARVLRVAGRPALQDTAGARRARSLSVDWQFVESQQEATAADFTASERSLPGSPLLSPALPAALTPLARALATRDVTDLADETAGSIASGGSRGRLAARPLRAAAGRLMEPGVRAAVRPGAASPARKASELLASRRGLTRAWRRLAVDMTPAERIAEQVLGPVENAAPRMTAASVYEAISGGRLRTADGPRSVRARQGGADLEYLEPALAGSAESRGAPGIGGLGDTRGDRADRGRDPGASDGVAADDLQAARVLASHDRGLVRALSRASDARELVKVLVDRAPEARALARELPGPAKRVVQQITSMQTLSPDEVSTLAAPSTSMVRTGDGGVTRRRRRGVRGRRSQLSSGVSSASAVGRDGSGDGRLMQLSRKLMDLIHLAEVDRRQGDAQRQVRRSDEKVEGAALGGDGEAANSGDVTLESLQREVLEAVQRELELIRDRCEGGPNGGIWW